MQVISPHNSCKQNPSLQRGGGGLPLKYSAFFKRALVCAAFLLATACDKGGDSTESPSSSRADGYAATGGNDNSNDGAGQSGSNNGDTTDPNNGPARDGVGVDRPIGSGANNNNDALAPVELESLDASDEFSLDNNILTLRYPILSDAGTNKVTSQALPEAQGSGRYQYSIEPPLPSGLKLNEQRRISGTINEDYQGIHTYRVVDIAAPNRPHFTIQINIVIHRDRAPAFAQGVQVGNLQLIQGQAMVSQTLPAVEQDGNGDSVYSLDCNGAAEGQGLPTGLSFDANTRSFSGTPTAIILNPLSCAYKVMDSDANTTDSDAAILRFTISVVEDTVPRFAQGVQVGNLQLIQGQVMVSQTLPAVEQDGNGDSVYSLDCNGAAEGQGLPTGLSFDVGTRVLSGTPSDIISEALSCVYKVIDSDANIIDADASTLTFSITVREPDTRPRLTSDTRCSLTPAALSDTTADDLSTKLTQLIAGTAIKNTPLTISSTAGAIVLPLACSGNGQRVYTLTPALPQGLRFNAATRSITGTPQQAFSRTTYTYKVTDSDDNTATNDSDSINFRLEVATDTGPVLQGIAYNLNVLKNFSMQAVILPIATGGNRPLVYSISPALPQGVKFDATTRRLSGRPTDVQQAQQYTYKVVDSDGRLDPHDTQTQTFSLSIEADTAPRFDEAARRIVAISFVQNTLAQNVILPRATGGNQGLRYSISPELPDGIEFNQSAHKLIGTPTNIMPRKFYTLKVEDEDRNHDITDTDSLRFSIQINEPDTAPAFSPTARIETLNLEVGTTMQALLLPQAYGGNGTRHYSISPTLPRGLDFNPRTRVLSGNPREVTAGEYVYTVHDADSNTETSDANTLRFFISITRPDTAPQFEGIVGESEMLILSQLVVNTAITPTVALPRATGGEGALNYSFTPALPQGLVFDTSTYVLSGTPTQAQALKVYTYTVHDSDDNRSADDADTLKFIIQIHRPTPPPSSLSLDEIEDIRLLGGSNGQYILLPEARGGASPYAYSLVVDPLTSYIALFISTRHMWISPSLEAGTYSLTYRVTDGNGDSVQQTFTITKLGRLSLPSIATQRYDKRAKTILLPAATGGVPPYRYTLEQYDVQYRTSTYSYYHNGITIPLENHFNFDLDNRRFSVAENTKGFYFSFLYSVRDSAQNETSQSFWMLPDLVSSTFDRNDKYNFLEVDLDAGLTFNVHKSAKEMLSLSQRAAQAWNTALSTAQGFNVVSNPDVALRYRDGLSTISSIFHTTCGEGSTSWVGCEGTSSNPLNKWLVKDSEISFNSSSYQRYVGYSRDTTYQRYPYSLLLHEIGHTLGLGHSTSQNHIMYPVVGTDVIHQDEVNLTRYLYDLPEASQILLSQFSGGSQTQGLQVADAARGCTSGGSCSSMAAMPSQSKGLLSSLFSLDGSHSKARAPASTANAYGTHRSTAHTSSSVASTVAARPAYTQLKIDGQDIKVLQHQTVRSASISSRSSWPLQGGHGRFTKLGTPSSKPSGHSAGSRIVERHTTHDHFAGSIPARGRATSNNSTGGWGLEPSTNQFSCGWRPRKGL